ncbi:hypothetical protein [uncultured Algibacter sp.]|uniref:hypothetical protein n=1 Tax=uncultured Algibacter sp. TaxID=298659 RepID=UPI003216FA4C
MKTLNRILTLLLLILSCSCDDILEEDITDDTIQTTFPTEGIIVEGNITQFTWQNLDGADNYRVQVLNENQIVEVDSLVTVNTASLTLEPGTYQWRVRGENFAYNTSYSFPVNFSTQASTNLDDQEVSLLSPSNNLYSKNINTIYTWTRLASATSYNFELVKKLNGEQTIFQETEVTNGNITLDATLFDEDAEYIWKVKALNATSESQFSQRSFFLDRVAPNQPSLASPTDQDTTTTMVTFNWVNGTDTGNVESEITNTIDIANDSDFNSIIFSVETLNNSVDYEFDSVGTYYWRIKAIDAATNESDYSIVRSLVVE